MGRPKGAPATIEHYRQMGLANKGRKRSEEYKAHMRKISKERQGFFKGQHHTEEHKRYMSDLFKGRVGYWRGKTLSEEHKQKIRDTKRRQRESRKGES